MEILLVRKEFTEESTIGELFINGVFECYVIEDKDRKLEAGGTKVFGVTAIPRGTYSVVMSFSNRFQKYLPEILNVPGFSGVRIHTGNKATDSEGCLILGASKGNNVVYKSVNAFNTFITKIKKVEKKEKITLTIV